MRVFMLHIQKFLMFGYHKDNGILRGLQVLLTR